MDPLHLSDSLSNEDTPRRLYWLMGNPLLVWQARQAIEAAAGPDAQRFTHDANSDPDGVWDAIETIPMDEAHTVLTVTGAQNVTDALRLGDWLKSAPKDKTVVFLSDWAGWEPPGWSKKYDPAHTPALRAVFRGRKSSMLVEAKFTDTPSSQQRLVSYVHTWAPNLSATAVRTVCARCSWDMSSIHDALVKASYFPNLSDKALMLLTRPSAVTEFTTALLHLDKPKALAAIPHISPDAVPGLLGQIDHYLDALYRMHRNVGSKHTATLYSAASQLGLTPAQALDLKPYVRYYDGKSVVRRSALVNALAPEATLRRAGVLEILVARW